MDEEIDHDRKNIQNSIFTITVQPPGKLTTYYYRANTVILLLDGISVIVLWLSGQIYKSNTCA